MANSDEVIRKIEVSDNGSTADAPVVSASAGKRNKSKASASRKTKLTPKRKVQTKRPVRRARAKLARASAAGTAFELPDVQEELEANPELQHRNAALTDELIHELELLVKRLMGLAPAYKTDLRMPMENIEAIAVGEGGDADGGGWIRRLQRALPAEMLDPDTLRGFWAMLKFAGQYQVDVLKRRIQGEYETDEWGMDQEFIDAVRPFFTFMYRKYWRVTMSGLEHVPDEGRAMLVSNHSGQLPFDGAMLSTGILLDHPSGRMSRALYADWFPTLPFVSDLLVKTGQVLAHDENARRLLEQDQLVAVFPEGYKGVGKLYKDRYHLARFGRGGFVRVCLKTRAPMLPVAIVGAEETYISLHKSATLARLTGLPYFPISPTFPLLGPLGFIPLPTKWYIDIGEPIHTDVYPDGSEDNLMLVSRLTEQVRDTVQRMIYERLAKRKSIFAG